MTGWEVSAPTDYLTAHTHTVVRRYTVANSGVCTRVTASFFCEGERGLRGCGRRIARGGRGQKKRKDLGWKWRAEGVGALEPETLM